jgi:hypothetical protein
MTESQTFIEEVNQDDDLFDAVLLIPNYIGQEIVDDRREELFGMFWEEMDLEREEVVENVKEREDSMVEEFGDGHVPDWVLRVEAQDILLEMLYEGFEEEGLIE